MFNNLFGSIQDQIADAKEERERHDYLLIISTPHERLIATAVVIVVLVLAAWLAFGTVTRSVSQDQILLHSVTPEVSQGDDSMAFETLLWLDRDIASQIRANTPVRFVTADLDDQSKLVIDGEVTQISPFKFGGDSATPEWFDRTVVYRVELSLQTSSNALTGANPKGRLVIVLGDQSPAQLLFIR